MHARLVLLSVPSNLICCVSFVPSPPSTHNNAATNNSFTSPRLRQNSWKTGEEQYGVEELDTDFCIVDTSGGAARVSKDLLKDWIGARYFDLIKAKDEYQPVSNSSEQRSTKRTIGYSLKEYVLPLGVEIVVLAEAAIDPSAEGGIILRRPSKKNMFDRAR
mmetsp:Transcript_6424/g.15835  ORF Transcript_6424/g.15835 Transcript_6424/m.15835 type:complete len:161 (+) Transcript_6424:594-1076(+)